ncbi:DUF5804 family protein [Natrinema sp. HArc-T2]|uniref:DUF5804 family protein n=1 Tax=Natrinema sp. HArc-T2 TaxID=3242701 RepID=UPI00359CFF81
MTRVCLLGEAESNLQYELLSRETAREALATYDLTRPFENALALRTVSVGAAVSLLNDLDWYLTRFVDAALVQEPSVSDTEWLSRSLATQLRNGDVEPAETAEFCKVYGLERIDVDDGDADDADASDDATPAGGPTFRLVEPLYVRRTNGELPAYDLRDIEETLVVRVTEAEFS